MKEEKFKLHAKNCPCFSCILRVPCGGFTIDSVRDPCDLFHGWTFTRKSLVKYDDNREREMWNKIMKEVIENDREKFRNNKSL